MPISISTNNTKCSIKCFFSPMYYQLIKLDLASMSFSNDVFRNDYNVLLIQEKVNGSKVISKIIIWLPNFMFYI